MGIGSAIKKVALGTAKVVGSAVLVPVGVAGTVVEYIGGGSGVELIEEIGHGVKSSSFNGVRKMWGAEEKEHGYNAGKVGYEEGVRIQKEMERLSKQQERK